VRLRKKVCLRKREVVRSRILLLKVELFYSEICYTRNWTLVQYVTEDMNFATPAKLHRTATTT